MKNRIVAFLLHLFLSALIASAVIAVVFWIWYPSPLHEAVGVTEIFLIVLSVDVVIGPLLTLIFYNPKKPSLTFDLSVIALLQICALSYGIHTVFVGRPAFIVFAKDRFEIARASDLDLASKQKALHIGNAVAATGWTKPHWVGTIAPSDPKRAEEIMFSTLQGGSDWSLLPELYVPLTQVKDQILAKAKPMQTLKQLHQQDSSLKLLTGWQDDKVKWLPLQGNVRNMVVLIDPTTAEIVEILDVDPWYALKA